jgi:hypothetical protein
MLSSLNTPKIKPEGREKKRGREKKITYSHNT